MSNSNKVQLSTLTCCGYRAIVTDKKFRQRSNEGSGVVHFEIELIVRWYGKAMVVLGGTMPSFSETGTYTSLIVLRENTKCCRSCHSRDGWIVAVLMRAAWVCREAGADLARAVEELSSHEGSLPRSVISELGQFLFMLRFSRKATVGLPMFLCFVIHPTVMRVFSTKLCT
ncbi:hypothetical protein L227DRAFT_576834 [Lentinus tigrinus ALCF2SS1-6]|uniref:Uncharacterized protein n=1 Tax=Lentinus tigrinus ALCF2SS1-6 TaxID=1328759 RepID=A0A5C2S577_9APHY|nr:hypothetical protein L227DRAFT_576834 [Lentinus tigrinus ALCF2SS1-6]